MDFSNVSKIQVTQAVSAILMLLAVAGVGVSLDDAEKLGGGLFIALNILTMVFRKYGNHANTDKKEES